MAFIRISFLRRLPQPCIYGKEFVPVLFTFAMVLVIGRVRHCAGPVPMQCEQTPGKTGSVADGHPICVPTSPVCLSRLGYREKSGLGFRFRRRAFRLLDHGAEGNIGFGSDLLLLGFTYFAIAALLTFGHGTLLRLDTSGRASTIWSEIGGSRTSDAAKCQAWPKDEQQCSLSFAV